jgi:hypothetical protein
VEPVPVSRTVLNCFRERGQTWVDRGLLRLVRKVRAVSAEVAALSVTAVPLRLTITLIDPDWWPVDTPGEIVAPLLATSLFLPLLRGDEMVGAIDLYSPDRTAFSGRVDNLARACGSTPHDAILDADLGFHSREDAEDSVTRLHEFDIVDVAIAYAVFTMGVGTSDARAYLQHVAEDFGIDLMRAADMLIDVLNKGLSG